MRKSRYAYDKNITQESPFKEVDINKDKSELRHIGPDGKEVVV